MAYLARARKADLITLTHELGLIASTNPKISQLTKLIVESENYDDVFTRNLLNMIIAERESLEKSENDKTEREFELRRLETAAAI